MDNVKVEAALRQLALDVKKIINERISRYGINPRVGRNTLEGSNLQRTLGVYPTENGIEVQIADYWEYVALGRKHTRKSNERGLYHALVLWALRKHIMLDGYTQNESAVILAENVWMNMIFNAPRPFMVYDKSGKGDLEVMIPELNEMLDKWFDTLFEAIIKDLEKYFNE